MQAVYKHATPASLTYLYVIHLTKMCCLQTMHTIHIFLDCFCLSISASLFALYPFFTNFCLFSSLHQPQLLRSLQPHNTTCYCVHDKSNYVVSDQATPALLNALLLLTILLHDDRPLGRDHTLSFVMARALTKHP